MGERKVLVRYVPPDFDPSIIPRFKRDKNRIMEVRMMLPFSMRCNTCGEYMGRGKKFNSRKENVVGDDYMGIRKYRFIIKCSVCSAEISFKTDPKNSDYECESGATRNFEIWKENDAVISEDAKEREMEEKLDAMKALENRTLDSKIEMDVLDALDEIKAINQRHERIDTEHLINKTIRSEKEVLINGLTAEDEAVVKSIRFKSNVKRDVPLSDSDEDAENVPGTSTVSASDPFKAALINQLHSNSNVTPNVTTMPIVRIAKKRKIEKPASGIQTEVVSKEALVTAGSQEITSSHKITEVPHKEQPKPALNSLINYSDSDDST
jgi:hypothetical protein